MMPDGDGHPNDIHAGDDGVCPRCGGEGALFLMRGRWVCRRCHYEWRSTQFAPYAPLGPRTDEDPRPGGANWYLGETDEAAAREHRRQRERARMARYRRRDAHDAHMAAYVPAYAVLSPDVAAMVESQSNTIKAWEALRSKATAVLRSGSVGKERDNVERISIHEAFKRIVYNDGDGTQEGIGYLIDKHPNNLQRGEGRVAFRHAYSGRGALIEWNDTKVLFHVRYRDNMETFKGFILESGPEGVVVPEAEANHNGRAFSIGAIDEAYYTRYKLVVLFEDMDNSPALPTIRTDPMENRNKYYKLTFIKTNDNDGLVNVQTMWHGNWYPGVVEPSG